GDALAPGVSPLEGVASLLEEIRKRVVLSERGEAPSDAAIFTWASVSPLVARRVNRVERRRIDLLAKVARSRDRAELFYYAFVGFIMRRNRVPALTRTFPRLSLMLSDILTQRQNGKLIEDGTLNLEDQ
ncbi:MAG TPA: hypothetical protein VEZ90_00460, partial [Blastocatellia bacterium]|nr:hypothetical protein [Blastocatellia bacterium]